MHKFNTYAVEASLARDGQHIGLPQAEVLGDSFNHVYTSMSDAEADQEMLQELLADEDNTLDPEIEYSVNTVEHTVEVKLDTVALIEDEPEPGYCYYISVDVVLDGSRESVTAMVGAPESDHDTIKASRAPMDPFCKVWWGDSSDHQDIPEWAVDEVLEALSKSKHKLYRRADDIICRLNLFSQK